MKSSPTRLRHARPGAPGKGEDVQVSPDGTPVPAPEAAIDVSAPPEDFAFLSPRETEYYLFAVESSLQVRRSHQFFLWAQGQLQSLLPHGVLICVHGNLARF